MIRSASSRKTRVVRLLTFNARRRLSATGPVAPARKFSAASIAPTGQSINGPEIVVQPTTATGVPGLNAAIAGLIGPLERFPNASPPRLMKKAGLQRRRSVIAKKKQRIVKIAPILTLNDS